MVRKELIQLVSAYSNEVLEYTPGNGVTFEIYEMGGAAVYNEEVKVEIKFGTDVLFVTHGDLIIKLRKQLTGDGSKKIIIKLTNDSSTSETLLGYYTFTEY